MNYDDAIDEERRKMISLSGAWFIIVTLTLSTFVLFYSYTPVNGVGTAKCLRQFRLDRRISITT